ncbi:MAG TPA: acyltransferase family protein [Arachnia sp.]|nr:acyltransferase family protein [Arachnia sp.]HMT85112.1 acyltransferase family protein [Arachnia sp.]
MGTSNHRLAYIDGLRAIAVLAVVWFHLGIPGLPSGFLGVDVFFVISGYVITRSLAKAAPEAPGLYGYLEAFYRRRVWRLTPALWTMIAVTLTASLFLVPPGSLSANNLFTAAGAAVGVSNIVLSLAAGGNYFSSTADFNPFLHTWSLGVEEQFYVLVPLLLWLSLRSHPTRTPGRGPGSARWIVPGLGLVSLGLAIWWAGVNPSMSFYLLMTRFWELAAGVVAFLLVDRAARLTRGGVVALLGWVGLALVLLANALPASILSPWPAGILPVVGTVLVLWWGESAKGAGAVLGLSVMAWIGRISYSLYLWHWPVIVLMRWTVGIDSWGRILVAGGLSLGFAVLSYRFIERPFQRLPITRRLVSRKAALAWVAAIAVAVSGVLGTAAWRQGNGTWLDFKIGLTTVAREPGWKDDDMPGLHPESRGLPILASGRLLVVGDSHAGAYEGAGGFAAQQLGLTLQIDSRSGCGFTLLEPVDLEGACADWRAVLDGAEPGDVVLFAALRVPRFTDATGEAELPSSPGGPEAEEDRERALRQLADEAKTLLDRGVGVVVDSPKPLYELSPYRCAEWINSFNPVCSLRGEIPQDELRQHAADAFRSVEELKVLDHRIVEWDAWSVLCPGPVCRQYDDGHPLFTDTDHLSGWGNQLVAPSLTEAVGESLAGR